MNDIFVAVFIVAAYLVFWQVWSGRWARSAWWALPLVGVLIGLAAATKWVGFYALAGLWVLVLARSDLGRLAARGAGRASPPWSGASARRGRSWWPCCSCWRSPWRSSTSGRSDSTARPPGSRCPPPASCSAASAWPSPSPTTRSDGRHARERRRVRLRPAGPRRAGRLARLAHARRRRAAARVARLALAARPALRRPLVATRRDGRLRAGPWIGACLLVIPLAVYALSYVPYLQLGHAFAGGPAGPGYGWSLDELHAQMFGYHFGLTAGHASASPWWSWPLDLKPTWFFNATLRRPRRSRSSTTAATRSCSGPACRPSSACAVLAWRRRSPALVLLVAAFAFQFVPWTRIERATFAYHYLTAVLFAMIAVAYVVDELLRRPAWRELAIGYLALVVVAGRPHLPARLGAADAGLVHQRGPRAAAVELRLPVPRSAAGRARRAA